MAETRTRVAASLHSEDLRNLDFCYWQRRILTTILPPHYKIQKRKFLIKFLYKRKNKNKKYIYFRANTNTALSATIMVAGTNNVKIPRRMFPITGATASNTPTCTPKNDTSTSTVPLVRNPVTSRTLIFNNPTTIPNKKTTHKIVV